MLGASNLQEREEDAVISQSLSNQISPLRRNMVVLSAKNKSKLGVLVELVASLERVVVLAETKGVRVNVGSKKVKTEVTRLSRAARNAR